ncbi:MAG TPA: polysaccharide biosynthesis/export family protein [Blastocatellia bacterium]
MRVLRKTRVQDEYTAPHGRDYSSGRRLLEVVSVAILFWTVQSLSVSAVAFGAVCAGPGNRTPQQDSGAKPASSRADIASASTGAESAAASSSAIVASSDDYHIGPSDIIEVRVEDAPELSRTFTVAADGTFQMPYLHQMTAAQKTTQQLEKIITDGLRGRYLVDPHVAVTVLKSNSRSYFIEGAVHSPGLYIIQGNPTLMKLITIAGGLADNHGSTAFIIRQTRLGEPAAEPTPAAASSGPGSVDTAAKPASAASSIGAPQADEVETEKAKYELITAHISGLFRGEFSQDKPIQPGDIVNIPPTDVFFVSGEVHKAGSFSLKEGTTLRQAISMAEGTTFRAAVHRAVIFRENPKTGKREEITVDLGRVMAGKLDDMTILANDVIEVPNSKSKTAFGAFLNGLGEAAMRTPVP